MPDSSARPLETRPAVSAAHIDGERYDVFTHGTAVRLEPTWMVGYAGVI